MLRESEFYCPECDDGLDRPMTPNRRDFLKMVGGGAAAVMAGGALSTKLLAADGKARVAGPAEELIRELFAGLSAEQKKDLVYPWDHAQDGKPTRLLTFNSAALGKRIEGNYSKAQQDLVRRTLRAVLSGDEAFERISRNGKWDASGSFEGCGSVLFGDPEGKDKFSWVFSGHHLTVRCDGNSEPGAAFGGPMYYGHSANGYSTNNVYNYQTQQVHEVFDALDEQQRKKARAPGNPGDRNRALEFRDAEGIAYGELSGDQQRLVEKVMRVLIDPFRKEDGDEVMQLIKVNGGMEKIHLAFYSDKMTDEQRWDYWRLEGPGFIWNYRVLPHVHCYVNIVATS